MNINFSFWLVTVCAIFIMSVYCDIVRGETAHGSVGWALVIYPIPSLLLSSQFLFRSLGFLFSSHVYLDKLKFFRNQFFQCETIKLLASVVERSKQHNQHKRNTKSEVRKMQSAKKRGGGEKNTRGRERERPIGRFCCCLWALNALFIFFSLIRNSLCNNNFN